MPTARELLEQADALMRRSRTGEARDAPPRMTTQSPEFRIATPRAAPAASPRSIQREPIAPSIARTALPVDPVESLAVPSAADAGAGAPPDDDFPLLTEAVDDALNEPQAANAPLDGLADDVPVLTDAVEEIDVGIVDESARGEPSFWELTARGETSVLGPAPDSVVVVPLHHDAPAVPPQSPPAGRDPLGLDQPPGDERPPVQDFEPDDRAATVEASTPVPDAEMPAAQAFVASPLDDLHVEDVRGDHLEAVRSATTIVVQPRPTSEARVGEVNEPVAEPVPERPVPPSEHDQQRIREIAEEIGMQVLQRIDIFSDTALRGQLGDRLQPVVERAAAELAAAINAHVGELLRAQIADAIEREMERFR